MIDANDITAYILCELSTIYAHPRLWSDNANAVETALFCYHDVWAKAMERSEEFWSVSKDVRREQQCGPYSFEVHYRQRFSREHELSEDEVTAYVIRQYQQIDDRLGIALPEKPQRKTDS